MVGQVSSVKHGTIVEGVAALHVAPVGVGEEPAELEQEVPEMDTPVHAGSAPHTLVHAPQSLTAGEATVGAGHELPHTHAHDVVPYCMHAVPLHACPVGHSTAGVPPDGIARQR